MPVDSRLGQPQTVRYVLSSGFFHRQVVADAQGADLPLGVVGRAHERSRFHVLEAEGERFIAQVIELRGLVVADERQVLLARAEVLAQR